MNSSWTLYTKTHPGRRYKGASGNVQFTVTRKTNTVDQYQTASGKVSVAIGQWIPTEYGAKSGKSTPFAIRFVVLDLEASVVSSSSRIPVTVTNSEIRGERSRGERCEARR